MDKPLFDVVGICMPCMDLNVNTNRFPTPNGGAAVNQLSWQGGNKVSSGMVAAARQGAKGAIMGAVGGDLFGRFCVSDFERHGIDVTGLCVRESDTTSLSIVLSDRETGGRSFVFHSGSAPRYRFEEFNLDFLQKTKYLFISALDDEIKQAVSVAREAGAKIVVDADHYTPRTMEFWADIDVFIASEYVYDALFSNADYERNCHSLLNKSTKTPEIIVFTLGDKGCVGISPDGFFQIPAFKVDVADTVGAGDVFHGAYIAALLDGCDAQTAALRASATAAIKCTRIGGRAGIPDRAVLLHFLETGQIDYREIDHRVAFYERGLEHVLV